MISFITRTRTAAAVLTAAVAITAPSAAQAAGTSPLHDLHSTDEPVPAVAMNAGRKMLSVEKAAKVRAHAKRTGHFPPAPRLLSRPAGKPAARPTDRSIRPLQRGDATGASEIPTVTRRPDRVVKPKLFGFQGAYATKKWALVNWVNYTYSQVLGSAFRQPRVYEVAQGAALANGCGAVNNAAHCWPANTVAFASTWSNTTFDTYGDAAFAAVMAHEYGHGAMWWLGFGGRGWFAVQNDIILYSEGFADCMAGAWLYWMKYYGYTDNVGRGDRQELYDLMYGLGSGNAQTTVYNHGDRTWRTALSTYGWNTGFDGCIAWGRQLAG